MAWQATDRRTLVSRSDLIYTEPVARSEEGIPIGNGRMGSLVWTTPAALKLQINRVDIQPMNRARDRFSSATATTWADAGFVDLELAGAGADAFAADGTTQRLSVYEGLLDVKATESPRASWRGTSAT